MSDSNERQKLLDYIDSKTRIYEMKFKVDKISVGGKTITLKAEYTPAPLTDEEIGWKSWND